MTTTSFQAKKPRFVKLMLIYLGVLSAIFLFRTYYSTDRVIRLQVEATSYELVRPNDQLLKDGNKFSSGTAGRLDWKPKNFTQAMLLTTVNDSGIDLFIIIELAVIAAMAASLFNGSAKDLKLTDDTMKALFRIAAVVMVVGAMADLGRMLFADYFVHHITQGQFRGVYHYNPAPTGFLLLPIFIFLMQIPQRGVELQKEAELTI